MRATHRVAEEGLAYEIGGETEENGIPETKRRGGGIIFCVECCRYFKYND